MFNKDKRADNFERYFSDLDHDIFREVTLSKQVLKISNLGAIWKSFRSRLAAFWPLHYYLLPYPLRLNGLYPMASNHGAL